MNIDKRTRNKYHLYRAVSQIFFFNCAVQLLVCYQIPIKRTYKFICKISFNSNQFTLTAIKVDFALSNTNCSERKITKLFLSNRLYINLIYILISDTCSRCYFQVFVRPQLGQILRTFMYAASTRRTEPPQQRQHWAESKNDNSRYIF